MCGPFTVYCNSACKLCMLVLRNLVAKFLLVTVVIARINNEKAKVKLSYCTVPSP